MTPRSFAQHLDPALAPKRILALDGGGLRGVVTLAFLARIETLLRARPGGAGTCLGDHFDLIGGTSTGAIIAAGLALGMSVETVRSHYVRLGASVFKPGLFGGGVLMQRYDARKVATALRGVFGERTLGAADYRTGLVVLCKRLDTGSEWVLTNNPGAAYFHADGHAGTVPNKDYPLWSVVRASTAAPTYFAPEHIEIARADAGRAPVRGEFIDGGVSTMNNPALQLLLTATVPGHGFGWATGDDRLELVSVGTGRSSRAPGLSTGLDALAAPHAVKALESVLTDCADMVEAVMQWLSRSHTARPIDRALGTLAGACGGNAPSLRYHRYDVHFEPAWFRTVLGASFDAARLDDLARMDRPANMAQLEDIGRLAAQHFVRPEHFMQA